MPLKPTIEKQNNNLFMSPPSVEQASQQQINAGKLLFEEAATACSTNILHTLLQDYWRRMALGVNTSSNLTQNAPQNMPPNITGGWLPQAMPCHGTVPQNFTQQNSLLAGKQQYGGRAAAEQPVLPSFGATAASNRPLINESKTTTLDGCHTAPPSTTALAADWSLAAAAAAMAFQQQQRPASHLANETAAIANTSYNKPRLPQSTAGEVFRCVKASSVNDLHVMQSSQICNNSGNLIQVNKKFCNEIDNSQLDSNGRILVSKEIASKVNKNFLTTQIF